MRCGVFAVRSSRCGVGDLPQRLDLQRGENAYGLRTDGARVTGGAGYRHRLEGWPQHIKLGPFRRTLTVLLWSAVHPVHLKNRSIPPTCDCGKRCLRMARFSGNEVQSMVLSESSRVKGMRSLRRIIPEHKKGRLMPRLPWS